MVTHRIPILQLAAAFVLAFYSSHLSLGATVSTPASIAINTLRFVIDEHLKSGGDLSSLSPASLAKHMDNAKANINAEGEFFDRMVLLGITGPLRLGTGERMIAYTSNQITEDRRDGTGRYVLWMKNGEIGGAWEAEEDVTRMLKEANLGMVNKGVWRQPNTKHIGVIPGMTAPISEEQQRIETEKARADDQSRPSLTPFKLGEDAARDHEPNPFEIPYAKIFCVALVFVLAVLIYKGCRR